MTGSFYKVGYTAYKVQSRSARAMNNASKGLSAGSMSTFTSGFVSSSGWIMMGLIYTAETGVNYRNYKKGNIDKKEFWQRMRLNSVSAVGGMAGGSSGGAAGFAIGTLIFPGIGSVVGAVIGGFAGGYGGQKLSTKAY